MAKQNYIQILGLKTHIPEFLWIFWIKGIYKKTKKNKQLIIELLFKGQENANHNQKSWNGQSKNIFRFYD